MAMALVLPCASTDVDCKVATAPLAVVATDEEVEVATQVRVIREETPPPGVGL
jgi:hypothetical protein